MKVNRIEKHIINKSHSMWNVCDELCFKSKNLYNYANYVQRQLFIKGKPILKYKDLTFQLKHSDPFKDLGSNSAQHTLKMLDRCWTSFFVAIKDYSKHPKKYLGKPKLPKYKEKNGKYICVLTNWQSQIKDGYLYFAFKPLKPFNNMFKIHFQGKHLQTRIIPKGSTYVLEIVYEKEIQEIDENFKSKRICGIDLGLDNFATLSNNIGIKSMIISGRSIKSYNQYWNKQIVKIKSDLKKRHKKDWSNKLEKLTQKRNNKMEYFMHCASKQVIDYCIENNIDTIVVGKNDKWKQKSSLNKKVNQSFVQLPYESFISKLQYKSEDVGIKFIENEEKFTSGTSFLDNEMPIKENYNKSRRIYRGLFKSNKGILINADLNGSYQIMRKVFPKAFADGIMGVDLHPIRVNVA